MSRDGYLPDNVRESDLPGNDDAHHWNCPANEDAAEIYSECGGEGECICYPDTLWGRFRRWWNRKDDEGMCVPRKGDCECADLLEDDKASAADAAEDARMDREAFGD